MSATSKRANAERAEVIAFLRDVGVSPTPRNIDRFRGICRDMYRCGDVDGPGSYARLMERLRSEAS